MDTFSYEMTRYPDTGWQTVRLSYLAPDSEARTVAYFTPEVGCNLLGLEVEGTEYLYPVSQDGETKILGTPILYPTPNRVRDSVLTWRGRTLRFEPNNGPNFIHGLVREIPWELDEPVVSAEQVAATARIRFAPGTHIYERFPFRNTLTLTYTLKPAALRLDFTVSNEDAQDLPFGLAIHPYFRVLGPRESVRLQVPAKKWMEAVNLLPTGRLLDLAEGPADLRQPTSLAALNVDDVFWGMQPDQPATIYYDQLGTRLVLRASELFTHSVVYTPAGRPFFCIENQSCSTDAHNLYAKGLQEAAHLTILPPGESLSAWIEFVVEKQ